MKATRTRDLLLGLLVLLLLGVTFGCSDDDEPLGMETDERREGCLGCHSDVDALMASADPAPPPHDEDPGEG